MEKDGSGDFTVIQDALDSAAEGDSILIGPGRYDDFRPFDFVPVGDGGHAIIGINTNHLTVVGVDSSLVRIGPAEQTDFIDGLDTVGIAVNHELVGLRFENLSIGGTRWGALASGESDFHRCHFDSASHINLLADFGTGMTYSNCRITGTEAFVTSAFSGVEGVRFQECIIGPGPSSSIQIQGVQDALVDGCEFVGNWVALEFEGGATGTISGCRFDDSSVTDISVVGGSHATIVSSRLSGGGRYAILAFTGGRFTASGNTIGPATISTIFSSVRTPADVLTTGNDILNGGGFSLEVASPIDVPMTLDFTDNYWGTTDTTQIDAWIHDDNDVEYTIATVQYQPIRPRSVPNRKESVGSFKSRF